MGPFPKAISLLLLLDTVLPITETPFPFTVIVVGPPIMGDDPPIAPMVLVLDDDMGAKWLDADDEDIDDANGGGPFPVKPVVVALALVIALVVLLVVL